MTFAELKEEMKRLNTPLKFKPWEKVKMFQYLNKAIGYRLNNPTPLPWEDEE